MEFCEIFWAADWRRWVEFRSQCDVETVDIILRCSMCGGFVGCIRKAIEWSWQSWTPNLLLAILYKIAPWYYIFHYKNHLLHALQFKSGMTEQISIGYHSRLYSFNSQLILWAGNWLNKGVDDALSWWWDWDASRPWCYLVLWLREYILLIYSFFIHMLNFYEYFPHREVTVLFC